MTEDEWKEKRIQQLEQERDELKAHCETLRNDLHDAMEWNWLDWGAPRRMSLDKTPDQSLAEIQAQVIEDIDLDSYDAGYLPEKPDQDYVRYELDRADEFYRDQLAGLARQIRESIRHDSFLRPDK